MGTENKYIVKFTAKCPNNDLVVDNYKAIIKTKHLIEVEKIIKYLETLQREQVFQEDLTKKISKKFKCKVKLIGYHFNVKIVSKYHD